MTTKELEQILRRATNEVYHLQAPTGVQEYVAWHKYGHSSLVGDDGVRVQLPKIQLDVIWTDESSEFLDNIKGVLSEFELPYFEADYGYDDVWGAMRCILQLELD